jgi:hypothetical protein
MKLEVVFVNKNRWGLYDRLEWYANDDAWILLYYNGAWYIRKVHILQNRSWIEKTVLGAVLVELVDRRH